MGSSLSFSLSGFHKHLTGISTCRYTHRPALSWRAAFAILLVARTLSAVLNIIHDCDEVYNYWEPLHYLLYGFGKQTWEYRCVNACVRLVNLPRLQLVVFEGCFLLSPPPLQATTSPTKTWKEPCSRALIAD